MIVAAVCCSKGQFILVATALIGRRRYERGIHEDPLPTWNSRPDDSIVQSEIRPVAIWHQQIRLVEPHEKNDSPTIDNDGGIDFVAGNLGLNSKIKADSLHPAQLYINDFDKNGTGECILTYYKSDGESYPYYLKYEMIAQMPALKKKFLRHDAYAGKTIDEIFDKERLAASEIKKAYQFQTCLFKNNGKGKFEMKPLPGRAQMTPVYGILVDDLDGDKISDIFLAGNVFGLKPELGRYDAGYGIFFKGGVEYISQNQSGLFYKGQVRDVKNIVIGGKEKLLLLAKNNSSLQLFKKDR